MVTASPDTPILVVGQTPPPFGGQAIMIDALLEGEYPGVVLHHVRMEFSRSMEDIGRISLRKALELIRLLANIHRTRIRSGARILYYPPAGPALVPVLRDMVVLTLTRPFFRRTIFHFHAGGIGNFGDSLPAFLRPIFERAYTKADVAVRVSAYAPDDGSALDAVSRLVIPNGVRDYGFSHADRGRQHHDFPPTILFVGLLGEKKGTERLLTACGALWDQGADFRLQLVGAFESKDEEARLRTLAAKLVDGSRIEFSGVLTGAEKWAAFADADIFCYPTHHETETFGLSVIEAMSFALPVVATRWRGLNEIVENGVTGYLVPIKDEVSIANRLARLVDDPGQRWSMGEAGRARYLNRFSLEQFHRSFHRVFVEQVAQLSRTLE